jgi:uridine kinase
MKPRLVAIVGGSGAGKTWLVGRLARALAGRAARLSLDDFYRDLSHLSPGQRARVNFDHPRAIDWPLLHRLLDGLLASRAVTLPVYDFATHTRSSRTRAVVPRPLVLVEGLWLLRNPDLRRRFSLRLFLDCPHALRRERRVTRDMRERGRTRAAVLAQFERHVAPMDARFVAPQARYADLVLRSPVTARQVRALARALARAGKQPGVAVRRVIRTRAGRAAGAG